MSFIERVKKQQSNKAPVEAAIIARANDIRAAREKGLPLNAIFRTLCEDGKEFGKGYSSFRQAVARLDKKGWPNEEAGLDDESDGAVKFDEIFGRVKFVP